MTGEVAGFTPEHEVQGSKRSRIRRIVVCVTLITLVGLAVMVGLAVTYASADSSGLIVYPDTFIDLDPNYTIGDKSTRQHYIDVLKDFEAAYTDATSSGQNLAECSFSNKLRDGMECRYEFMWLGSACNTANNFGYMDDQPCIVLAFNEPREWTPKPYTSPEELPKEMPESLRTHIESLFANSHPTQFLWVSCTGQHPADKEFLGPVELSPWPGFPLYYFPVRTSSRAPILGLTLRRPEFNTLINIECHFWAKNLETPHVAARIELLSEH